MMHVIPIYQSSRHVIIMIVVLFVIQVNLASVWDKLSENIYIKVFRLGYPTSLPLRLLPHVRSKPGLRHPQNITMVSLQEYQAIHQKCLMAQWYMSRSN